MTKKKGMGKDPFANRLNWIKDTTAETPDSSQAEAETPEASAAKAGLKSGWTRATMIVRDDHLEAIKALAYWRREQLKDLMSRALALYLDTEKKALADALAAYHGAKER
jgi:hypothetical protein